MRGMYVTPAEPTAAIDRPARPAGFFHKVAQHQRPTRLCDTAPLSFPAMSVASELRRRVNAEQSLPQYEPCLQRPAKQPPAGPGWLHEIKHDGFRIIAYRSGDRVQLVTRAGNNFASRFPLIAAAIAALLRATLANVRLCENSNSYLGSFLNY
jgi:ATP-dependent DNA ligase